MADTLIQRARHIAADTYIRLEMKKPTNDRNAAEWAQHVEDFSNYLREGCFDQDREVQTALAALRSVIP